MPDQTDHSPDVSPFQLETTSAVARVRASFSAMTKAVGRNIERPADFQRELGVDGKLSWQVFNVINGSDSMAAATYVPGLPSLNRLIRAAQVKGVPSEITDSVRAAVAELERVIERHADDRTEFNLMASSLASTETAVAAEREWRKAAYRAERHIWGVSADSVVATAIVRLDRERLTTDECGLMVKRGFRRLRPEAALDVFGQGFYGAQGFQSQQAVAPLNRLAAQEFGAPILPEFCTNPVPPLKVCVRPDGYHVVRVASHDIGRQTSVDLTMGSVSKNCPLAKDIDGAPLYQFDLRFFTPARLTVMLLLVHRPSFGLVRPDARIFRQSAGDDAMAVAMSQPQIPVRDKVEQLASGRAAWQEHSVDRHDELVQMALRNLQWDPAEFDVFRFRMEYPVLNSVIRLEFRLPNLPPAR